MKLIWCISLLLLITVANAQVTFQKKFGHPQSNVDENVTDAALDPWGNMYITGSNNLFTFNLAKVDTLGTTHWMKRLSTLNLAPQNIICSTDTNLVLSGTASNGQSSGPFYLCMMKTDTAANILWSRYLDFDSTNIYVTFLFEDFDGNLVTGGFLYMGFDSVITFKTNPFIAKFDSAGMLLWYKRMIGVQTFAYNDGIVLDNGNYLMAGYAGDTILGGKDVLLVETDTSGSVLRSMVLGNSSNDNGHQVIQHDKNILINSYDNNSTTSGSTHFIQLDSTWSIIQNRKHLNFYNSYAKDIIPYINNTFLISSGDPMVYLLDTDLLFIEGRGYGGAGIMNRIEKTFHLGDGRIFCAGTSGLNVDILTFRTDSLRDPGCSSNLSQNFNDIVPFLLTEVISINSFDTMFTYSSFDSISNNSWTEQVLCNSYTGISEWYQSPVNDLVLYPNPTTDILHFYSNRSAILQFSAIEIFDIMGRSMVKNTSYSDQNNAYEIDLSELLNGIYFLKLESNENIYFERFMVCK